MACFIVTYQKRSVDNEPIHIKEWDHHFIRDLIVILKLHQTLALGKPKGSEPSVTARGQARFDPLVRIPPFVVPVTKEPGSLHSVGRTD